MGAEAAGMAARSTEAAALSIVRELRERFPAVPFTLQETRDGVPTLWLEAGRLPEVLRWLKGEAARPYATLYDLTAIDERERRGAPVAGGSPPRPSRRATSPSSTTSFPTSATRTCA